MPRWLQILMNLLGYDVAWSACILGAARGRPWTGVAIGCATLAVHLALSPVRLRETGLLLVGAAGGLGLDLAMHGAGVYTYRSGGVSLEYLAVFFLLWLNFGTTLRVSLRWAWSRPWAGALLGLAGGPIAYWAADRIGAITLGEPTPRSLTIIGALYAAATPAWLLAAGAVLSEASEGRSAPGNPPGARGRRYRPW